MWLEIYKTQVSCLLKKHQKQNFLGFKFKFVRKILNKSFCNFCFLVAAPPHVYSGKFLILMYYPKMLSINQNAGFSKLQYSRNNGAMKLILFLRLETFRANQLIQLFYLVLIRHAQFRFDRSNSKIFETPITQEKQELFNYFLCIWILIQRSYKPRQFFQGYFKACSKCFKTIFQRLEVKRCLIIIIVIIIIIAVLYLTLVIISINDTNNYKSHSLQLGLFTPSLKQYIKPQYK